MQQKTKNKTDAETLEGQFNTAPSYSIEYEESGKDFVIEYEIEISEGEREVEMLIEFLGEN